MEKLLIVLVNFPFKWLKKMDRPRAKNFNKYSLLIYIRRKLFFLIEKPVIIKPKKNANSSSYYLQWNVIF